MTPVDVALTILNFTAAEFAQAPALGLADRTDALLMSEFEGIAISAPAEVAAGARVPIAVAVRFDHARAWDVPLGWNTALVATNLDTGRVVVTEPFTAQTGHKRHGESAPLERGPRPPDGELEGVAADISWTDFQRARVPAEPGTWRVAVVYHDWVSNAVEITVAGPPPAPEPREPWPRAAAETGLPTYLPRPGERPGFALDIGETGGRQVLRVSGHVEVPLRPWMAYHGTMRDQGAEQDVIATVPVAVLWMEHDGGRGHDLRFLAPVYGPPPPPGRPARADFSLDLLAEAEAFRLPAGRYAVWLLAGGELRGPEVAELHGAD